MTIRNSDGLQFVSHCTKCKSSFREEEMQFVGEEQGATILHVSCTVCRQNMLITLMKKESGLLCAGTITDLSFSDAKRVLGAGKVTIDDVLSVHEALELDNFMKIG